MGVQFKPGQSSREGIMKINPVFLYIPNLIGYLRVLCYISAFVGHAWGNWALFIGLYLLAFLLDEFDGRVARRFDQMTHFGAALDMVTDRCATAGLCLILSDLYPRYTLIFILLIALDISSHYYLLYATGILGHSNHKQSAAQSKNQLLSFYYGNKQFMDALIIGNELFYVMLYWLHFDRINLWFWIGGNFSFHHLVTLICLPFYFLKQATNLLQLISAVKVITQLDQKQHHQSDSIGQ